MPPNKKKRRSSCIIPINFSPVVPARGSPANENEVDNNVGMNHVDMPEEDLAVSEAETRRSLRRLLFVVGGSIVGGWVAGMAGLSVAWLLLLVAAVILKWNSQLGLLLNKARWTEMERVRRRRAAASAETAEWLNVLLHRWWMNSGDNLFNMLRAKIEPLLNEVKPPFVEKIEMSQFTFGEQTPSIQDVRSFDLVDGKRNSLSSGAGRRPQQKVELEVGVLLNSEQFQMLFSVRLFGKGMGMDVEVAVENLHICGKMSVIFTLDRNAPFPGISNISVSFIEKPDVWFTIKVMKSLQMMEVPILKTWLHSIVVDALESALVNPGQVSFHPNPRILNAPTPNGDENSSSLAQGVLIVTLASLPDYINDNEQKWMALRVGDETKRTRLIIPGWTENIPFLIHSLQTDRLEVKLKTKRLVTSVTLAQYEMALQEYNLDTSQAVETHLQKRNPRLSQMPSISLKLEYFPMSFIDLDNSPTMMYPSTGCGVLTVMVHKAYGLSCSDSNQCNPYCIVFSNRKKVKSTPYFVNTVNPSWQSKFQMIVPDFAQTSLSFVLCSWNLKKMTDDEMLGMGVLSLAREETWVSNKDIALSGSLGAFLTVSFCFQPIEGLSCDSNSMSVGEDVSRVKRNSGSSWVHQAKNFLARGDQDGPSGSDITNLLTSGMGLMEVTLLSAKDLLPMDLNGFSDPFCELKINGECKYKSSVKKKTLNPVWDENAIMPMPRLRESLDIMVWDHDTFGMKDFLGNVNFTLDEIRSISAQSEPSWYQLKGVRSGAIQLRVKIISEDSSFSREVASVESSPVVRRASMERSRVRLGVHVPPPTPPRTVSIPRPPVVGRDARDTPELTLPLHVPTLTLNDSPTNTHASSPTASNTALNSVPPSPTISSQRHNEKHPEVNGFRSMRLKVSRSLRLRRFKSEVNVRDNPSTMERNGNGDGEAMLNHAASQPNIPKALGRAGEAVTEARPDTYTGVQGCVIQAQGLHVAHVAQFYMRIKLFLQPDKQVNKTLAKSHLLPSVPNPQFQLDFQIANPESVPRQAALLFEIRSSTKEVLALRRVTLQDLLPGDLKEMHTWLALNNGATLEVSIGHGHIIKKKSKKLFRSWSVHRIGKI